MDDCLAKGVITFAALEKFGKQQAPYLVRNVAWAAQTQVGHWMSVVSDWKKMLGSDWEKTYAASNTIYVARQNNILFSVLAQFFGPDAINSRLILIETISFTTTPEDMMESLTRIIADRSVGRAVLRQLSPDGLRADGWRCARRDHRRKRQARNEAFPASAGAVWLESVADIDHAGAGPRFHRRPELQGRRQILTLNRHRPRKADDPVNRRRIVIRSNMGDYWIPAFAGMTLCVSSGRLRRFSPRLRRARPLASACPERAGGRIRAPRPSRPACRRRCGGSGLRRAAAIARAGP